MDILREIVPTAGATLAGNASVHCTQLVGTLFEINCIIECLPQVGTDGEFVVALRDFLTFNFFH